MQTNDLLATESVSTWWSQSRLNVDKAQQKEFDGVIAYLAWDIWRERNNLIFENNYSDVQAVSISIKQGLKLDDWLMLMLSMMD